MEPYCLQCGKPVKPNVPRLGWEAGAVHLDGSNGCLYDEKTAVHKTSNKDQNETL